MRLTVLLTTSAMLVGPAAAGDWGGSIATRAAYNDFHIYYDDRDLGADGSARTEESLEVLSVGYVFNF